MSKCESCPVKGGPCVGESGWLWACPAAARGENLDAILAASSSGPPPPAGPPPLWRKAKNLAGAVVEIAASGGARVSAEEYQRRRSICKACPTGRYDAERDACRACGCYLQYKPLFAAMKCPDSHWPEVRPEENHIGNQS